MERLSWLDAGGSYRPPETLWEDGERRLCRTSLNGADGILRSRIVVVPVAEHPTSNCASRFDHEYALREDLEGALALQPVDLLLQDGRPRHNQLTHRWAPSVRGFRASRAVALHLTGPLPYCSPRHRRPVCLRHSTSMILIFDNTGYRR